MGNIRINVIFAVIEHIINNLNAEKEHIMKHTLNLRKSFVVSAVILFLLLALQNNATAQFNEQFNSSTLDPAWQIVEFTGTRVYGYTSPANHISLTDNLGYLRYYVDRMTHRNGFAYNFQKWSSVSYTYDPGLELRRTISGENWLLEAKASYYLPYTNGRDFVLDVYFGNGNIGTFSVQFQRGRDVNQNMLRIILAKKTDSDPWRYPLVEDMYIQYVPNDPADFSTFYFRLERAGGELTTMWSEDGATCDTAFNHDMGTLLDGLTQTVVVTGESWFNPEGSYADWDYITVTPTVITVDIDIKPGSDPNCINNDGHGSIPVAILGSAEFDVTQIDPASVRLEGLDIKAVGKSNKLLAHIEAVNSDEDDFDDLIVQIEDQDGVFIEGSSIATVTGNLFDGSPFQGTDEICIVPPLHKRNVNLNEELKPEEYALYQNYPNPFNPETEIRFQLLEDAFVVLKIYNSIGQEICVLAERTYKQGSHNVLWDGKDMNGYYVPSGIYIYSIQAGEFSQVKKMVLLR
jgi:hypothetical protein